MTQAVAVAQGGTNNVTMRNRIINGAMMIDQRNAGASVTPASGAFVYNVDRWGTYQTQASKITVQQNAGSVTPPAGFSNYVGVTSSSAYSVIASDQFLLEQAIEANNIYDLAYGTVGAQTVTLSFWVRSSLTGTFAGCLRNYAGTRSYPFTYAISSANAWQQVSITVAGDTSGTWVTSGSGGSMYVIFNLGSGATFLGTAGAWATGNYTSVSGSVNIVGTSGATFYITGVQLEAGSTATPFENRLYGTELALCQRYYEVFTLLYSQESVVAQAESTTTAVGGWKFLCTKRAQPTMGSFGTITCVSSIGSGLTPSTGSPVWVAANTDQARFNLVVTSGLTAGNATHLYTTTSASPFGGFTASAEL